LFEGVVVSAVERLKQSQVLKTNNTQVRWT